MHHNENANRIAARKADGSVKYTISRKKQFKQNPTLQVAATEPTYSK